MIKPKMTLECAICGERPLSESVVEAFQLHCQVEHDTDELKLNLVAVCECVATMVFLEERPTGGGVFDFFLCPVCGESGRIFRNPQEKEL